MRGLLSMIGMQAELDYMMGDFSFGCMKPYRPKDDYGGVPTDKQKCQPKV